MVSITMIKWKLWILCIFCSVIVNGIPIPTLPNTFGSNMTINSPHVGALITGGLYQDLEKQLEMNDGSTPPPLAAWGEVLFIWSQMTDYEATPSNCYISGLDGQMSPFWGWMKHSHTNGSCFSSHGEGSLWITFYSYISDEFITDTKQSRLVSNLVNRFRGSSPKKSQHGKPTLDGDQFYQLVCVAEDNVTPLFWQYYLDTSDGIVTVDFNEFFPGEPAASVFDIPTICGGN